MNNDDNVLWRSDTFKRRDGFMGLERPFYLGTKFSATDGLNDKNRSEAAAMSALGAAERLAQWYATGAKTFANSTISGTLYRQLQSGESVQWTGQGFDPITGAYNVISVAGGNSATIRDGSDTWTVVERGPIVGPTSPRPMSVFVPDGNTLKIVPVEYGGDKGGAGPLERDIREWNRNPGTHDKDMSDYERISSTA